MGDRPLAFYGNLGGIAAGNNPRYVHVNNINTPVVLTDTTGTVGWTWVTEPYGQGVPDAINFGSTYDLRFPGQFYDSETGNVSNGFRDYDSSTGRYLESDPIGLLGGINTYVYAKDNPLRWSDRSGLCLEDLCIGEGILALEAIEELTAATETAEAAEAAEAAEGAAEANPGSNVIPFPTPNKPDQPCDKDDGCKKAQSALLNQRIFITGMYSGKLMLMPQFRQNVLQFNEKVSAHNARCPNYPVAPIPLGPTGAVPTK